MTYTKCKGVRTLNMDMDTIGDDLTYPPRNPLNKMINYFENYQPGVLVHASVSFCSFGITVLQNDCLRTIISEQSSQLLANNHTTVLTPTCSKCHPKEQSLRTI